MVNSVEATPLPEGQPRFQRDRVASRRMLRDSVDRQKGREKERVIERCPRYWEFPLKMPQGSREQSNSEWLECKVPGKERGSDEQALSGGTGRA